MTSRRFKWKWTDFAITALLVLFIVLFFQKVQVAQDLEMPEQKLTVTIVAEKQYLFFKDTVQEGDLIYQKGSAAPFGKIVDVQEKPAKHLVTDQNGRYYERELKGLLDIYLTIESVGFRSLSNNPVIDHTFFHVNQYLPVMTHQAHFATRVIEIR